MESWQKVKTFEEACKVLEYNPIKCKDWILNLKYMPNSKMLISHLKLSIIRKVLNLGWNPDLCFGPTYTPYIYWYEMDDVHAISGESIPECYVGKIKDVFTNKIYAVYSGTRMDPRGITGDAVEDRWLGFPSTRYVYYPGFLSCKDEETALYLGKNFWDLIIDAIYGQFNNYELHNK